MFADRDRALGPVAPDGAVSRFVAPLRRWAAPWRTEAQPPGAPRCAGPDQAMPASSPGGDSLSEPGPWSWNDLAVRSVRKIYCADLATGLASAEGVGDSGLPGNNVVLGEVDVDNSFAGHRFVTVTVVTARGIGVPVVLAQRPHNYPSPSDISYGAAGPLGPVILVTSGAARNGGFTCDAAFQGRATGAAAGWLLLDGSVQQGDVQGVEGDPPGRRHHAAQRGHLQLRRPGVLTRPAC